jgi:hypothetical protein
MVVRKDAIFSRVQDPSGNCRSASGKPKQLTLTEVRREDVGKRAISDT